MATSVPVVAGYVGASTGTSTTAVSLSLPYSSLGTINVGDLIIVFGVNTYPIGFTVPTGYTSDYNITTTFGGDSALGIACHQVVTTPPSGSLTLAWHTGDKAGGAAAMVRVTGVNSIGGTADTTAGSKTTATAPTPNTTSPGPNDMVLRCYLFGNWDDGSFDPTAQISTPSGWTNAVSTWSTSTNSSIWNAGVSLNYLQDGTSTPTVTYTPHKSGDGGDWIIFEYDLVGMTTSSTTPELYLLNVPTMRSSCF